MSTKPKNQIKQNSLPEPSEVSKVSDMPKFVDKIVPHVVKLRNKSLPHRKIIFGAFSSPQYIRRRRPIRNTWWNLFPKDTRGKEYEAYWIMGGKHIRPDIMKELKRENDTYGDIKLLPMKDKYEDLSMKTMLFIKYAIETYNFDYILKCDDDAWILPNKILEYSKYFPKRRVYYGRTAIYNDSTSMVPQKYLPLQYAAGGAYILSHDLALHMYNSYWMLPIEKRPKLNYFEDVGTAVMLADLHFTQIQPQFMDTCDRTAAYIAEVRIDAYKHLYTELHRTYFESFCGEGENKYWWHKQSRHDEPRKSWWERRQEAIK